MNVKINPLAGMIKKFAAHAAISVEDRASLFGLPYALRAFETNTYLVREGDNPDRCCAVVSGYAYRSKTTGDGRRQIVSIHGPGEVVDLQQLYLHIADNNVQAMTRCEVVTIPCEALRKLAVQRPTVAHAIFTAGTVELSVTREWMLNIGRRDACTRMAHLLCELAVRLAQPGSLARLTYELPMTQEQLGDALGLTAVHVSRTIKQLVRDGLIVHNKRAVQIPNWELLVKAGDFNTRYLHLAAAGFQVHDSL
jgi:CRP-like cAMP-binding protein